MSFVVNFFGGPGCGKSTVAYELTGILKRKGYKAELVVEEAKWLTYSASLRDLKDQYLLAAKDNHKINLLKPYVDIIVMDGSLLNGLAYCTNQDERSFIWSLYRQHNNIGFTLPRPPSYEQYGRKESLEQAIGIDTILSNYLLRLDNRSNRSLEYLPMHAVLPAVEAHVVAYLGLSDA